MVLNVKFSTKRTGLRLICLMLLNDFTHIGDLEKLRDQALHLATVLVGRFAYFGISCDFVSEHNQTGDL